MNLELHNLQRLICHKNQQTKKQSEGVIFNRLSEEFFQTRVLIPYSDIHIIANRKKIKINSLITYKADLIVSHITLINCFLILYLKKKRSVLWVDIRLQLDIKHPKKYGRPDNSTTDCSGTIMPYIIKTLWNEASSPFLNRATSDLPRTTEVSHLHP